MFIARISRGRTLREFILGVMVVPTALALLWIGILGGNAIHEIIELVQDANYEAALYVTIDLLSDIDWLTWAMSVLATLLLATWFITSSDSGTLVITTLLSMGDPPPAFSRRLGTRGGSGGCRAAARRRAPGLANRRYGRRPAKVRCEDRW